MEENHESQDTSAVTPDQEQVRAHWRDRFEKQATARLSTLKDCAAELYGQAMVIGQGKDLIYRLSVPGIWAKTAVTVKDAGLAITDPATHAKIILALAVQHALAEPAPVADGSPLEGVTAMEYLKEIHAQDPEEKPELTQAQRDIREIMDRTAKDIAQALWRGEKDISGVLGSPHVSVILGVSTLSMATRDTVKVDVQLRCGAEVGY